MSSNNLNELNSQLERCQYELSCARSNVEGLEKTENCLRSKIREFSEPENNLYLLEKITASLIETSQYDNAKDCTINFNMLCSEVNTKNDNDVKLILEKLVECGVLKRAYEIYCDYIVLEVLDSNDFEEPYYIECCGNCEEEHHIYKRDLRPTYKLNI